MLVGVKRKCQPGSGIGPGAALDRLEQEFLKEEADFVRKSILLTLAPQRLQIRPWIRLSEHFRLAAAGAGQAPLRRI